MKEILQKLKQYFSLRGRTVSGNLGFISILLNIYQIFIQIHRLYFWLVVFGSTVASYYFYRDEKHKIAIDKNLILINVGLLIFGLPFSFLIDYMDFFRFVGIVLVIVGLLFLFLAKKMHSIYNLIMNSDLNNFTIYLPRLSLKSILFILVILGFLLNQYLMYKI